MKKILLLLAIISTSAHATDTIKCHFTNYSNQEGNHKENLQITFVIDKSNGKAYTIGNNGSNEVAHIDKGNWISFIEITASGNVMTTTVDTNMKAVHSRNSVGFTGELLPSQYYGACTIQ